MTGKSFRLIDFHVLDASRDSSSSSSEDDEKEPSTVPRVYDSDGEPVDAPAQAAPAQAAAAKSKPTFTIQMFGINEKGETVSIFVPDFQPFFYVKCADTWTDTHAERLLAEFRKKLGYYQGDALISAERAQCHPLYGFTGGKTSQFVKLSFRTLQVMSRVRNFWYTRTDDGQRRYTPPMSQGCRLEIYESKLPPLLRYFHIHTISPSGWVFVPTKHTTTVVVPPEERTTHCHYEYICSCHHLISQSSKESRVPYKICSFDIEASSSHGDFPLPIKSYKRLASQVVDTYHAYTINNKTTSSNEVQMLIEKSIKSAFGYGKCEGIDLVYPKIRTMTKSQLEPCLKQLWTVPGLDPVSLHHRQKRNRTIESMFEDARNGGAGNGGNEGDEGEVDDAVLIEEDDDVDDLGDVDDAPTKPPIGRPKAVQAQNHRNLYDVLTGSGFEIPLTRDEQIMCLSDAFPKAGFPPLEGDKVTFIGSTFMRYGESEPYLNHCIVLDTCDPVSGVEIVSVPAEIDVLLAWTQLIERENPDIILGYNIFGFDYEFMFRRAQETGCEQEFLRLSRNVDEFSAKETTDRETGETTVALDNTKIVLATGEYDLRYPIMRGRIQLDLYTYFRRDFNLASYKLDDVAGEFIRDDILRVTLSDADAADARSTTDLHTRNVSGLRAGDFIHIELSGFTSDYYRNGTKFRVLGVLMGEETNIIRIAGHEPGLLTVDKKLHWCMAKDDVTPQDIFRLTAGSSADRAVVAKYCIQDCNLVHHLMNKIDVLTGYIEMARICSVPLSFLIFRGQGIKLTSYVAKKCREKNTLMPDMEKSTDMDGYEGAIVLPPKCGMYMDNPVACVDYSSLYPSAMISQNFSHDSKVWTKEYNLEGTLIAVTGARHPRTGKFLYDDLPGYKYIDMEFDTYHYRRNPAKPHVAPEKIKAGRKICRWAQLPEGQKSIMPAILEELLQARSDTRKQIKTTADPFIQNILDKRQLGYKVTANSLYGQCGSKTSSFYEKDVAASTTATGRTMISYAKNIIENVYGDLEYDTKCHGPVLTKAEYVYGDSVASYTPVYVRRTVCANHTGAMDRRMDIVCISDLARFYGKRFIDHEPVWSPCRDPGKEDKEVCELEPGVESWSDQGWTPLYRVIRHKLAAHKCIIRIITDHGLVDVTDDHSLLRPDGQEVRPGECSIGTPLLHCDTLSNVLTDRYVHDIASLKSSPQLNTAIQYFLKRKVLRTDYRISEHGLHKYELEDVPQESIPWFSRLFLPNITSNTNGIRAMHPIPYTPEINGDGYVYDLTTKNHHFSAGIGDIVVHNTDSVFFTFNLEDPVTKLPIRGQKALEITIEIAQDAAHLCTQWLKPPMSLAYEKTLMPFVLLSKKRYVGMLYEEDPNKGKLKYMGISLKRRDSCDYLKDTYGGILTRLMTKDANALQMSMEFLNESLRQLIAGTVSMDKLTITRALSGYYKNPHQIAHWVLAERMGKRDAGTKPKPGERMKFVHVEPPKGTSSKLKLLQGDLIETPEYILANGVHIDYIFYISNQLMKPLQQLFGLAVEQLWEQQGKRSKLLSFRRDMDELQTMCRKEQNTTGGGGLDIAWMETYMKKKEKICSAIIKQMIFDPYLVQINNRRNNAQMITAFFPQKKT
jgi:DNA polymerase elongation subunit (family B)